MKGIKYLKINLLVLLGFGIISCNSSSEIKEEQVLSQEISIPEIEQEIKTYIDKETESNGGFFPVKDQNHDLKMKLVRVHTEYLSNLGPERHFACVDLVDEKGDVYDVDFFMSGIPGRMSITQTSVHKLNGKPYYSWKQREDKTWYQVPLEQADNSLLGVIEGKDNFEFTYTVILPDFSGPARLWMPIPISDEFQQVELLKKSIPIKSSALIDPIHRNEALFMNLGPEDSGKTLELTYEVQRKEKGPYEAEKPDPALYLAGNTLMPVGGRFEQIAKEVLGLKLKDSHLVQARSLYDYIIDNMRYMKFGAYGKGDSNYACDSKTGNCSEFHSYFISLARSVGIPARFAIGASIPSDRNEGGIDGYHCWAEFYAEGKWWPIDISEANKYTALATYYFGRHPANRIEFTRGRDLMFDPSPAQGPINFLAYPYLEVNGKEIKATTYFTFKRNS